MGDTSLFIAAIGAILVSFCSTNSLSFAGSTHGEPVRMASESLVVKSYKDADASTLSPTVKEEKTEEYQVYQGVMGRPGIDFPVYSHIPQTSFTCRGVKKSGYYADLATDCQVFHVCDRNRKVSFLCPNGTIFRQSHLICDWWFRVDCGKSVELYDESAEQLEADQKVYKARAEERERRRKLTKGAAAEKSESNAKGAYSTKSSSSEQQYDSFESSTKSPLLRFNGRKSERNFKRPVDTFSNFNSGFNNENKKSENVENKNFGEKEVVPNLSGITNSDEDNVKLTNFTSKINQQFHNSIAFENNRENIYGAESGRLVENLSNRKKNLGVESNEERIRSEINSQQKNNNIDFNSSKRNSKKLNVNNRDRNTNFPNYEKTSGQENKSTTLSDSNFSISNKNNKNNYHIKSTQQTFTNIYDKTATSSQQNPSVSFNNQNINSRLENVQSSLKNLEKPTVLNGAQSNEEILKVNNNFNQYFASDLYYEQQGRKSSSNVTTPTFKFVNFANSNSGSDTDYFNQNTQSSSKSEKNSNLSNTTPVSTSSYEKNTVGLLTNTYNTDQTFENKKEKIYSNSFNNPTSVSFQQSSEVFSNQNYDFKDSEKQNQYSKPLNSETFNSASSHFQQSENGYKLPNFQTNANTASSLSGQYQLSSKSNNYGNQNYASTDYRPEGLTTERNSWLTSTTSYHSNAPELFHKSINTFPQNNHQTTYNEKEVVTGVALGNTKQPQRISTSDGYPNQNYEINNYKKQNLYSGENDSSKISNTATKTTSGLSTQFENQSNQNYELDNFETLNQQSQFRSGKTVSSFVHSSTPSQTLQFGNDYQKENLYAKSSNQENLSNNLHTTISSVQHETYSNNYQTENYQLNNHENNNQQTLNAPKEKIASTDFISNPISVPALVNNRHQTYNTNNYNFPNQQSTNLKTHATSSTLYYQSDNNNQQLNAHVGLKTNEKIANPAYSTTASSSQQFFTNKYQTENFDVNNYSQENQQPGFYSQATITQSPFTTTQNSFKTAEKNTNYPLSELENLSLKSENQTTSNFNQFSYNYPNKPSIQNHVASVNFNGDSLSQNNFQNSQVIDRNENSYAENKTYTQTTYQHDTNNRVTDYTLGGITETKPKTVTSSGFTNTQNGHLEGSSNPNIVKSDIIHNSNIDNYSKTFNKNEEIKVNNNNENIHKADFTSFESKSINKNVERESVLSTAIPRSLYPTYSSSTSSQAEEEKQIFAESASFTNNRGGKSYSDYQNKLKNAYSNPNQVSTVTENSYKTVYTTTAPSQEFLNTHPNAYSEQFTTNPKFHRTTYLPPQQQRTHQNTGLPFVETQPYTQSEWQTTTIRSYYETTTPQNFYSSNGNVYNDKLKSEHKNLENINYNQNAKTELFPPSSGINLSLQELNINKDALQKNNTSNIYKDFYREGLEVPPSSGPNAIRSFALYFANGNYTGNQSEFSNSFTTSKANQQTFNSFEDKKKEVLKQVDEIVQQSSVNVTDITVENNKLPNSLTVQTQDSYLTLFPTSTEESVPRTTTFTSKDTDDKNNEFEFKTTNFGEFTEEPTVINLELNKNDLAGSQSRGLVEPEPSELPDGGKIAPDLRKLAQVFTKALSAYLDDPQGFRKVLTEIRPTEPTLETETNEFGSSEYSSSTNEDEEVLDFSDVSKISYKKKSSTPSTVKETNTEFLTTASSISVSEIDNLIVPTNNTKWETNFELKAPPLETLDESQSSYYTPPTFTGTTNAVAEEINQFITHDKSAFTGLAEDDSYFPEITTALPVSKYGGFQNNSRKTTKYSPYGSELSSPPFPPLGENAFLATTPPAVTVSENLPVLNQENSFYSHFNKNETKEDEIQLSKELNNLVLLQKFTTPRGKASQSTISVPTLSTSQSGPKNSEVKILNVDLGNGETLEKNIELRTGKNLQLSGVNHDSNYFQASGNGVDSKSTLPSSTPKGFLITYSIVNEESSTYLPSSTSQSILPTTFAPVKRDSVNYSVPYNHVPSENFKSDRSLPSWDKELFEYYTTTTETATESGERAAKSLQRIAQLQETLMFNTNNPTIHQKDMARETVEEMMDNLNITASTTHTLMKVMEMAAKNETYRRLVLLLVNDKSGRNKTVEEARLSLLKALLTPVIKSQSTRTQFPIQDTSKLGSGEANFSNGGIRRSKSIQKENTKSPSVVATPSKTTTKTINKIVSTTTSLPLSTTAAAATSDQETSISKSNLSREKGETIPKKSDLGNIGVLRRTIENSKNKQVKINAIDDAVLDSDSRAVELLRSLYSLAARWG